MTGPPPSFLERLAVIRAALPSLDGFGAQADEVSPDDLGPIIGELAEFQAQAVAQMALLIAAAESAGVVERSQCANTRAWVAQNAWHARSQAGTLARAAAVLRREDLEPVARAVLDLDVTPAVAATIADTYDKTKGTLEDGCEAKVLEWFIHTGAEHGTGTVRSLREHVIATFGKHGSLQEEQDRCTRQIDLSPGRETRDGVYQYELTLDAESRALMEAAIGPGSAPATEPDGRPDPRSVGRRRGDALVGTLRRSVSLAASAKSGGPPTTVVVTMELDKLVGRIGAGTVLGTRAQDTLLAPDTVRRMACDADIIPAVLGSDSEIVDLGRRVRLFNAAQNRALWLRDRHCTFDGCTAPAAWCRTHHLIHWLDGGLTDLANAALLCSRHHSIVHRDQLAARPIAGRIVWDRTPGSYHRLLTEVRRT
ncbi:DUF222 domain-containing protein [Nakamurella sp. A5-74]|uniref:DUF222 domain-containing protein n=1 Tax=Nakamurella sp. A5-74 TaxID=3158264 RepID=A0AAU8DU69_9ACTN